MAENPVGHFPDDFGTFDDGAFADWKSILYSGRNRNRGSGCPADLRHRDGAGAVESFSSIQAGVGTRADSLRAVSALLFSA